VSESVSDVQKERSGKISLVDGTQKDADRGRHTPKGRLRSPVDLRVILDREEG